MGRLSGGTTGNFASIPTRRAADWTQPPCTRRAPLAPDMVTTESDRGGTDPGVTPSYGALFGHENIVMTPETCDTFESWLGDK
jgi:hypothetical protein